MIKANQFATLTMTGQEFKTISKLLHSLHGETTLKLTEPLRFTAVDPSHVYLIGISLENKAQIDDARDIQGNYVYMHKDMNWPKDAAYSFSKLISNAHTVRINISQEAASQLITVEFSATLKDTDVLQYVVSAKMFDILRGVVWPKLAYDEVHTIFADIGKERIKLIYKWLKEANKISDHITITKTPDTNDLVFFAENSELKEAITLEMPDVVRPHVNEAGGIKSMYPIDQFKQMLWLHRKDEAIVFHLANDFPIEMIAAPDGLKAYHYIAPRIED